MKIFIDSAEIEEIKIAMDAGILDGVTTNPSLLKNAVDKRLERGEKTDIVEYIKTILQACKGRPVSLEAVDGDANELAREGLILWNTFRKYGSVVIKIPVNPSLTEGASYDGIKAISYLAGRGIPINTTLVFTPLQALLAAKAGAKYVSPFAGRVDDYLRAGAKLKFRKDDYYPKEGMKAKGKLLHDAGLVSGVDLVRSIVQIFRNYGVKCEVLAASLRNARQVHEVAEAGADIATMPFSVLQQLLKHTKTLEGMKKFLEDAPDDYRKIFE